MPNRGWVALASAGVFLLACDSASAPQDCPSLPLTVSVTSSTTPTFTWTPNCVAHELIVYEVRQPSSGGDQPVWIIGGRTATASVASPIVYGHVPLSMRQVTGPLPLVMGRTYRVSILNSANVEMGSKIFGP